MSCISKRGRCTSCCEAIHIPTLGWIEIKKGRNKGPDAVNIKEHWVNISKRRAKKINPHIFKEGVGDSHFLSLASFFTCKRIIKGSGCSVRHLDSHPGTCKRYTGGTEYSPTCEQDINIIARSGG